MPSYEGLMPVYGSDNAINDYTKTLGDADSYMYSVQHAKDLHQKSLPPEEAPDEEIEIDAFGMSISPPKEGNGIPEDMNLGYTPNIQLEEQEESVLAKLFNAAPKSLQQVVTPALMPWVNNPVVKGITGGLADSVNGVLSFARDINNVIVEGNGGVGISEEAWLQLPEIIERGDSTTEALVGGLTQFLGVYSALGKFSSVNTMSSGASKLWNDMWRSAISDAAFAPEDGNLSSFINELDFLEDGSKLGAVTEYLGTPIGEDADAFERLEQRAKNLMEGAGLGAFAHGVIASFKGMKKVMIEANPDKYFAMLKKAGFDVDPRTFLMENKQGAENIITPPLNELGMYSQLEKAMLNNRIKKHQPEDLLRYLFKNEVSEEELTNSGVMDLINEKKAAGEKITTDEVMEVFTDSDVTQSYKVITREYGADSNNINSMTDEDELLEIYRAGGNGEVGVNGRVLDHAEMYDNFSSEAADISSEWLGNINGSSSRNMNAMEDSTAIASNELLDLEVALKKSDPAKYGDMSAREILQKVRNIDNDNVFSSDVDEAVMKIAESNYDQSPIFQWELNEGDINYTIIGNEDSGYTTKINDGVRSDQQLDVVYSANEAMVQVQRHSNAFGDGAMGDSGTKWHEYITEDSDINSYKETIITADSPSGETFKGDAGLTHFPDDDQVFHIRTTNRGSNTLFIEEIQSDWNNAISKSGVKKGETFTDPLQLELITARENRDSVLAASNWKLRYTDGSSENLVPRIDRLPDSPQDATNTWSMMSKTDQKPIADAINNVKRIEGLIHDDNMAMPVTPLAKDKWMNVGLRKAIAMAIDAGQTRVEWTTAADQVKQWGKGDKGENFEEMYINLYNKKLGGLAKKIANKYKSTSGSHYIEINDEMIKHHKSGKGDKLVSIKGSTQYA